MGRNENSLTTLSRCLYASSMNSGNCCFGDELFYGSSDVTVHTESRTFNAYSVVKQMVLLVIDIER